MSRFRFLFLVIIFCGFSVHAQVTKADYYNTIDNKIFKFSKEKPDAILDTIILFVNTTFQTSEDRARAYYTWIALNISYDVEHMNEMLLIKAFSINSISSSNQKASDVLMNRKAVCEGYSNLMNELCKGSSIPCFLVCGYTKTPSGDIPDILHAWNVLRIDSAWTMLDITWSSGYVNPMNKYVKRFSNKYFLPKPKNFIKDHLPIDPMWQLLKNPFTKKDFENDSLIMSNSPSFNFPDSLYAYRILPEKKRQYVDFLHYYRAEPNNQQYARNLDVLNNNLIVDKLNVGVFYQTDFVELAQKKLSKKPTLSDCKKGRSMLDSAQLYYIKAQNILITTKANTVEYSEAFVSMKKTIDDNCKNLKINYDYLNKLQRYLKKK